MRGFGKGYVPLEKVGGEEGGGGCGFADGYGVEGPGDETYIRYS